MRWKTGVGLDSAFEWRYAAFSVSIIRSGESGSELSSDVLVDATMINAPVSVQVGRVDTSVVRSFLGRAFIAKPVGDTVELCVPLTGGGEAEEEVRLWFVGGRLRRALWAVYTGWARPEVTSEVQYRRSRGREFVRGVPVAVFVRKAAHLYLR